MEIVLSMALGITLLLVVLLIRKLKENRANAYLLVLLVSVFLGTIYAILFNYFNFSFFIIGHIFNALPALFGVFTFLYVRQSLAMTQRCDKNCLFHSLPFILATVLSYFETSELSFVSIVLNIGLKILVSILYLIISHNLIQKQQIFTRNHFSNLDKVDLKWLHFIVKLGLISYFLYFFFMLLWAFDVQFIQHIDAYSNLVVLIFILPISYYGLTTTTVFAQISSANYILQEDAENLNESKKVEHKTELKELISSQKADEIFTNLLFLIETKKIYLLDNLMLEYIAKELNLHSKYLSYVINNKSGKTFFDFINYFRVKEFNKQVLNPANKHLTLLAIAFNCGFGSKSSFNRAYKNEMGISPSQFIKKHQL